MLKSLMLASAIAIAAPALAQTTGPTGAKTPPNGASAATGPTTAVTNQTTPTTPSTAQTTPATPATPVTADQTTPATPGTATEAPANAADTVAQLVERDWAKYDNNSDGVLSKEEFGMWMAAIRSKNRAANEKPEDVTAWTDAAFAQADKDKSGSLTKPELEGFLRG